MPSLSLPSHVQDAQFSTLNCFQNLNQMNAITQRNDQAKQKNVYQRLHLYQDQNLLMLDQHRSIELQIKLDKEIYQNQAYISSDKCLNCLKWKNWAIFQQKMLLQLQRQMILKEQKIQKIIQTYRREIIELTATSCKIVQKNPKEKINSISSSDQILYLNNQKIKEMQEKRRIQESSKQQNKIDFLTELYIEQSNKSSIFLKDLRNFNKLSTQTTESLSTAKTDGFYYSQNIQSMKKERNQNNIDQEKSWELQKLLFQNQALKDYNIALVERLKIKKCKRNIHRG